MQLNKANNIIEQLQTLDTVNFPEGLQCWVREEKTYNIYIFSVLVEDESHLQTIQENVRDYIAIYFQGQILEKEVERWNIYQVFFCKEPISSSAIKLTIEQDKFATRKIVLDNNIAQNISAEAMKNLIYDEIFKFEFKPTIKNINKLSESLTEDDKKIVDLATSFDLTDNTSLFNFVTSICNE
ncbi:MAG: hypothetical protein N4A49_06230 [Marinifilaceae bacterium]|jgi:hypothetical protein|nr:hypothetical protein [Marinifilaceae bacterium]